MGALRAVEFVSLDGVMQGFHVPDERDGFQHSGWGVGYEDEVQFRSAVAALPATKAYLFGRRTYDELAQFWPFQPDDNPMAAHLNHTPKFVATRRSDELSWSNARRLDGDLVEAVTRLKAATPGDVAILGSGALVEQLLDADLIDGFEIFLHPLVLGSGHQLFPRTDPVMRLELGTVTRTTTGVVQLSYETVRPETRRPFRD
jgi:dihydrofolate reductase